MSAEPSVRVCVCGFVVEPELDPATTLAEHRDSGEHERRMTEQAVPNWLMEDYPDDI